MKDVVSEEGYKQETLDGPGVVLEDIEQVVRLGHQRWDIENYGFQELANEWHSDHVFKHDPGAIECFLLVTFLAYNIFHAFLALNVKPAAQKGKTQIFWARLIAAELYSELTPVGMSP